MAEFTVTPVDHDPFAEAVGSAVRSMPGVAPIAQGWDLAPDWLKAALGRDVSRLGNSLTSALTSPSATLFGEMGNRRTVGPQGQVSPFDPQLVDAAANLAGVVPMGALALPKPAGALGIFGGRMAKTADMGALEEAIAQEKKLATVKSMTGDPIAVAPAHRAEIMHQTGWFRGTDGKWRFEIPDHAAEMDTLRLEPGQTQHLDEILNHPKLFSAYPNLRDVKVKTVESKDFLGQYDPYGAQETISMASDIGSATHSPLGIMLHELQHATQSREGFAHGAAPRDPEINAAYEKVLGSAKDIGRQINDGFGDWLKEKGLEDVSGEQKGFLFRDYLKTIPSLHSRLNQANMILHRQMVQGNDLAAYMHVAGEVEARNVENRFGRTTNLLPWQSEDTPKWAQIVRFMK